MSARLPLPIAWLIRVFVPAKSQPAVTADLHDDYAKREGQRGSQWWLLRETLSLTAAYSAERLRRCSASLPMWTRDLTMVLRGFRRGPLAALGAAAMLSTGLTAVLLTLGLADTLLLRRVSAAHRDTLRRIVVADREGRTTSRLSFVELERLRQQLQNAGQVASVNLQPVVVRVERTVIQTLAEVVDGPYFALTGTEVLVGRRLLTLDERPAAPPVVVISEPFWRQQFGASPTVPGTVLHLNGEPFTIVGVARATGSASFIGASVDVWVSTAHADPLLNRGWRTTPDERLFTPFVLPTQQAAAVETRLDASTSSLAELAPEWWRDRRLRTTDATVLVGSQRTSVLVLAGILAALSLLILCTAAANLGGLLLARAAAARRHVAIHLSIGAGRAAMARRQLLEGALLGLAGAILAIGLYAWGSTQLAEITLLPTLALRLRLPLDLRLVGLICAGGAVAGLLLALGPAIWATRLNMADALRDLDVRADGSRTTSRVRRVLVSAQVALTLVLVVAAVLFTQSLREMVHADLGIDRERLVAFDFDLEPAGIAPRDMAPLAREVLRRVAATPGVVSAAMSNRAPIDVSTPLVVVRTAPGGPALDDVSMYLATAGYFDTVGVPIVAGRPFSAQDTSAPAAVVVVNEALAQRLFPVDGALDRAIYIGTDPTPLRVVGVARNSKYRSITETLRPHVYRPTPPMLGGTLLVRTSDDPAEMLRRLQATLDVIGPGVVGFFPRTLEDHLAIQLLPARAAAAAASALGILALCFSGLGLYALVSWFVELRRREIGIRMALGATSSDVVRMIVRQTLATALPGVASGVVLAAGFGLLVRSAIFGVRPIDPLAGIVAIAALVLVVAAAAYGPSRRASRVDPAVTLRA